jgi:hypothetical protein
MNAVSGISIGDGLGGEFEADEEAVFGPDAGLAVLDGVAAFMRRLFLALAAVLPLAEVQIDAVSLPLAGRDEYVGGRDPCKDIWLLFLSI